MVGAPAASSSLKEYLKKYQDSKEEEKKKKKKKKKEVKSASTGGLLVVDQDTTWQKPVNLQDEEDNDSADEEKPQVDEDIEVKRMKRLEFLRNRKPFGMISEDGSGWTTAETTKGSQSTDQSPLRRRRSDTPSPERDPKASSSPDLSPPRKRSGRHDSPSPERGRRSSRAAEEDLSPPRQRQKHSQVSSSVVSDADMSPPRRVRQDDSRASSMTDLSPPRKGRSTKNTKSALSDLPGSSSGIDLSPPRKKNKETSAQRVITGLVTGKDVKEEIAKTKKEELQRFKEMESLVSGRGAQGVYRDKKTGAVMSKEDYLNSKKKEKPKEIKLEWGKGLAQKREAEAKLQELETEKEKPFARTRDDPELDKMLKERVRFGDPMAHLVKKKQWEPVLENLGDNEKMQESGFIIPQDIPQHSWLRRNVHPPANRYGIKPGRHWDGVDRSTGYEQQMFKRSNEKQATEREAYLWSVADM